MSSGKSNKIFQLITEKSEENISEFSYDFSRIIIPFSKIFKPYKTIDIYSGNENIPFKERDPEFKMILQQEFFKS